MLGKLGRSVPFLLLPVLWISTAAVAQDNTCDPGEEPDVIVGDIYNMANYGTVDGKMGFSIGTESCNIGTCWANWQQGTPNHPVIGQNMYRLKDGRFEQIGVGWLKHSFATLDDPLCSNDCIPADGQHLGVNCSDPYGAGLNGQQSNLGPRYQVNPETGFHEHPFAFQGQTGNATYKRMAVAVSDMESSQNPGALYFVESQYVTIDDAEAGNSFNNNSHRRVFPNSSGTNFTFNSGIPTRREEPAIIAWQRHGGATVEAVGRFVGGFQATDLGDGWWHYEYALQNLTSDRSARSVTIPLPHGVQLANVEFVDADYHSGEPFDHTDWSWTHETGPGPNSITWSTDNFLEDPNANALRWGTIYNFRFDADVAPAAELTRQASIGYFKPGVLPSHGWRVVAPERCGDGFCESPESEALCPSDCAASGIPAGSVPDGDLVQGPQLQLSADIGGDLGLSWGESCVLGDDDYAVYEGVIGDFASHTSKLCSTAGQTSTSFTPAAGGRYYLIVPTNGISEGSYGSDSQGLERPMGLATCEAQEIEACE